MAEAFPRGVYGITPDWAAPRLFDAVELALSNGLRLLQYRNKSLNTAERLTQAHALAQQCARYQAQLIINDDPHLALAVNAAGVHLGKDDTDIASARALLGRDRWIGVSCYNHWALAEQAMHQGADYIAFGAVFASPTKPHAVQAPLELFQRSRAAGYPSVAIGGISVDNAGPVIEAGAHAIAVITALFDAPDIAQATRAFNSLF